MLKDTENENNIKKNIIITIKKKNLKIKLPEECDIIENPYITVPCIKRKYNKPRTPSQ